ncbi:hypothetical protein OAR33_00330 [bacterium]|nr:hypothetical protein [bacterium]
MEIAAYGIRSIGGTAAYGGVDGGQQWFEGSSEVIKGEISRDVLTRFFAPLSDVQDRAIPEWPNQDGVINVIAKPAAWYIVHTFQPRHSIARSVPLWLCVRLDQKDLASGMVLGPTLSWLDECRRDESLFEGERVTWFDREKPSGPSISKIDELRSIRCVFDELILGTGVEKQSLRSPAYWQGVERVVRGLLDLPRMGSQQVRISIQIEATGRPSEIPGVAPPDFEISTCDGASRNNRSFVLRGVRDEELITSSSPEAIVKAAWARFVERIDRSNNDDIEGRERISPLELLLGWRAGRETLTFPDLVDPPLYLVPPLEVRESEVEQWCRELWAHSVEYARERLSEVVSEIANGDSRHPILLDEITGLVMASPAVHERDEKALGSLLRTCIPD